MKAEALGEGDQGMLLVGNVIVNRVVANCDVFRDTRNILEGNPTSPTPIVEQTYLENILRLNIGKLGTFYFTYTGSNDWRDRAYKGIIEQVGRDHFIISDPKNNKHYLFQFVYFDWAEFDEELNYHF